jgi:hypothetical protein
MPTNITTGQDAWQSGYEAACNRKSLDANPFSDGSPLFHAWEDGWQRGNDPDYEEKQRDARNA